MSKGAMDYSRFESPRQEPQGVFRVEIKTNIPENKGWELWEDGMDWWEAKKQADIVKSKNFEVRIIGADEEDYGD